MFKLLKRFPTLGTSQAKSKCPDMPNITMHSPHHVYQSRQGSIFPVLHQGGYEVHYKVLGGISGIPCPESLLPRHIPEREGGRKNKRPYPHIHIHKNSSLNTDWVLSSFLRCLPGLSGGLSPLNLACLLLIITTIMIMSTGSPLDPVQHKAQEYGYAPFSSQGLPLHSSKMHKGLIHLQLPQVQP